MTLLELLHDTEELSKAVMHLKDTDPGLLDKMDLVNAPPAAANYICHLSPDIALKLCEVVRKAIEALSDIANHKPESIDKTVLLLNIEGYRERAARALRDLGENI